jgi:selenoprotein W-related protein
VQAELVKGSGGVFDVTADGEVVYSKHRTGRFPDNAEVVEALRARR